MPESSPLQVVTLCSAPGLHVGRVEGFGMLSLRIGDDEQARWSASSAIGIELPTRANSLATSGTTCVAHLGPDEWLLIDTRQHAGRYLRALEQALSERHAAVVDVTGNRAWLRVSGTMARDILSGGCSLDLDPPSFRVGDCASTLLARAAVVLLARDVADSVDVLPRRSFCGYVEQWLVRTMDAASGAVARGDRAAATQASTR